VSDVIGPAAVRLDPPLAHRFPFSAAVLGPVHCVRLRDADARPRPEEVAIEADWRICCDLSSSPVAMRAALDLQTFLDVAMGLRLPLAGADREGERVVSLSFGSGNGSQACVVAVTPRRIALHGADAPGLLQGVYHVERLMQRRRAPYLATGEMQRQPVFGTRVFRSPLSPMRWDELLLEDVPYSEGMLDHLAHEGFDGIWLHGRLRDLVPPSVFPELGAHWQQRQARLAALIRRAADYGIRPYLYLTEPLGFSADDPFWQAHPDLRGERSRDNYALCSSTDAVREWLARSYEALFTLAPGLGGVILITASESLSHCYSHVRTNPALSMAGHSSLHDGISCPRCREIAPQAVVSEILGIVEASVHAAQPAAEVIAWSWSWNFWEPDPQPDMLRRLPAGVTVMADVECGGHYQLYGQDYYNDEYSNVYVGPGERFRATAAWLRDHDRPLYGRTQLSVAHEAANVPFIPLLHNVAEKYERLRQAGCIGLMETWNFGNFLTPMTAVANAMAWEPRPESVHAAVRQVAVQYYGEGAADIVVAAWRRFADAAGNYPLSIPALYYQPLNWGPAFPLFFEPAEERGPNSYTMNPIRNHRVADWIAAPFTPAVYLRAFADMHEGWERALALLRSAEPAVDGALAHAFRRDLACIEAFGLLVRSNLNVTRFALARDRLHSGADRDESLALLDEMAAICRDHLAANAAIRPLLEADPRLGFHGEAFAYQIDAASLDTAAAIVADVLERRIPDHRARLLGRQREARQSPGC
jgi:hypothetical protein